MMIFQRSFFALVALLFVTTVTFEGGVAAAEQQRRQAKSGKNGPPPPPSPGQYYKKSPKSSKKNRPTPSPVTSPTPSPVTPPTPAPILIPPPEPTPVMTEKALQSVLRVIKQIDNDKKADADAEVPQELGGERPVSLLGGGGVPNKFAVSGGIVDLRMGYSIVDQEKGNFAFEPIKKCVDDDVNACIETVISNAGSKSRQYTIYDTSTRSSFMKAAISAEGGSVGTKVSASVEVMTTSEMSLESVSHILLGTTITYNERIKNAQKLKLTGPAKNWLTNDRERFIRNFGLTFVTSITKGGSFMSSFDMVAKKSSSEQELKAEASFTYEGGLYSAEGSAKFEGRQTTTNSNTKISSTWDATPDPYLSDKGNRGEIASPAQMLLVYGNWSETVKENPAPIFLETNAYSVSEDVQLILQKFDADKDSTVQAIEGSVLSISSVAMEMATTELVDTVLLIKALNTYKDWEEVKKYKDSSSFSPFYKKLETLSVDAGLYRNARMTSTIFTDASLVALNRQLVKDLFYVQEIYDNGNRFGSWRYFSQRNAARPGLQQRFDDGIKPGLEKLTGLKCRPQAQGNDPDQYIPGKNRLVNGFGLPMGDCGEHHVCRDEVDENGKAVLQVVEDKMKICLGVYYCEYDGKYVGNGLNCFNHPSPEKAGTCCPANAYCDPAVESFDVNAPPMCRVCTEFEISTLGVACKN